MFTATLVATLATTLAAIVVVVLEYQGHL